MYIVTGSITSALRLSKAVQNYSGLPASVVHTPSVLNRGGCSYSVKTDVDDIDIIKELAPNLGISIKGMYGERMGSEGRVFYDIS